MVVVALVLSLLTLPAFGVRQQGLEGISFSSQPLNALDHHPAGLIEVEAGTGGKETEKKDQCDNQLGSLLKRVTETCERHTTTEVNCRTQAKDTIKHSAKYYWQDHLASTVLDDGRTPVFWAGFWPGGNKGIDTREALADFISSVNGFQLADTEWGQAAESKGANNLEACTWARKKNWWNAASRKMAEAMALHKDKEKKHAVKHIIIALHKTLHGHFSFYNTSLYQAELPNMGFEMKKSKWNPRFEVRSIAVRGSPPNQTGCALASLVESQLERHAERKVRVRCRLCTTLQSCGDRRWDVENNEMEGKCIKGDCQNGKGQKVWPNGDRYEGGWKNGEKDGTGTYTWSGGKMKYEGEYKKDLQDGQGTFTYTNGDQYQGGFKKDQMDGEGTVTLARGKKKYQVVYKKGKLENEYDTPWR